MHYECLSHWGQAWNTVSTRHQQFRTALGPDPSLHDTVMEKKRSAQLVVVEHQMLRGLQTYASGDKDGGQADINAQIRSFGAGSLKSGDLVPGLWKLCLQATRGQQV